MKINKSCFFWFFLLIMSCLTATEVTIFIYMAADNGLYYYAEQDLLEMQKGLAQAIDKPTIIVYLDYPPHIKNGKVEYLKITPSTSNTVVSTILKSYPDEDSGSGNTLLKFLNWAYPRYHSEINILTLWSHGDGWMDNAKGIGDDASSLTRIGVSTGELYQVFQKHQNKYDLIILDACNSGSLELISELAEFTDYVITSPNTVPSEGYPWIDILPTWNFNSTLLEITELFLEHYRNAYSLGGRYKPFGSADRKASASVYDIRKHSSLLAAIKEFANEFADDQYSIYFNTIRSEQNFPAYNPQRGFIDIDFSYFIKKVEATNNFTTPQKVIISNLVHVLDEFIVNNVTLFDDFTNSISIYYPQDFELFIFDFEKYWSNLKFASSGWSTFLNFAFGVDTRIPYPVSGIVQYISLETIYMNWKEPLDPCPLEYQLTFYNTDHLPIDTFQQSQTSFTYHINPYQFTQGKGFYTIETISKAGNYSPPRECSFEIPKITNDVFYIAPNPVRINETPINIYFYLNHSSSYIKISIYNIAGSKVWENRENFLDSGEYKLSIDSLTTGVYIGVMQTDHSHLTQKFAVIK